MTGMERIDVTPVEPSTALMRETCVPQDASKRIPCDACGHPMEPEHAHYKCPNCSYILPCCGW